MRWRHAPQFSWESSSRRKVWPTRRGLSQPSAAPRRSFSIASLQRRCLDCGNLNRRSSPTLCGHLPPPASALPIFSKPLQRSRRVSSTASSRRSLPTLLGHSPPPTTRRWPLHFSTPPLGDGATNSSTRLMTAPSSSSTSGCCGRNANWAARMACRALHCVRAAALSSPPGPRARRAYTARSEQLSTRSVYGPERECGWPKATGSSS
mmetsp:Transcript_11078/g.34218  ORF Transcript_11078/g.34218 Transcript_11078/m.34218 type:complete len:207 (+) Transcript_11078:1659-2279(+)